MEGAVRRENSATRLLVLDVGSVAVMGVCRSGYRMLAVVRDAVFGLHSFPGLMKIAANNLPSRIAEAPPRVTRAHL